MTANHNCQASAGRCDLGSSEAMTCHPSIPCRQKSICRRSLHQVMMRPSAGSREPCGNAGLRCCGAASEPCGAGSCCRSFSGSQLHCNHPGSLAQVLSMQYLHLMAMPACHWDFLYEQNVHVWGQLRVMWCQEILKTSPCVQASLGCFLNMSVSITTRLVCQSFVLRLVSLQLWQ